MWNSKGGQQLTIIRKTTIFKLALCCLLSLSILTTYVSAQDPIVARRLEEGNPEEDGADDGQNQIIDGADEPPSDEPVGEEAAAKPKKQSAENEDDTAGSLAAERQAASVSKMKYRTSANVAKQNLNEFEIEDIQARYRRGEYQIKIESIAPKGGPTRGETQVLVRFDNLAPFVDAYPHPRCKFGGNSYIVDAQYVKCTRKEEDFYANEGAEKRNAVCVQCEASPAHKNAEVVPFTVSLSGIFDDSATSTPYRFYNNLEVTAIYPRYGPKDGDTIVQVWGKNFIDFGDDFRCNFGTRSTKAHFINSNYLWCRASASDVVARPMPFSVSLNRQQMSRNRHSYWYYNMQQIWEVLPDYGSMTGETKIQVKGSNFKPWEWDEEINNQNDTFCSFGALGKQPAQVLASGIIECLTPDNSQKILKVPLKITINNQNYTDDKFEFAFFNPPQVVDVKPLIGPLEGSNKVTVYGQAFEHKTMVCMFGKVNVTAHVESTTKITCDAPHQNKTGEYKFKISYLNDRFASEPYTYTYFANPNITAVKTLPQNVTNEAVKIFAKVVDTQVTYQAYVENKKIAEEAGEKPPPIPASLDTRIVSTGEPGTPATPGEPGTPATAGEPGTPATPGEPGQPVTPGAIPAGAKLEVVPITIQPEITKDLVACGPIQGFTQFNVIGNNFIERGFGNAKCIFNNSISMNATVISVNLLICDSPPLESTTGDMWYQVSITLDGSLIINSTQIFKYYRQPYVASVEPAMGPIEGGTESIIRGHGFTQKNMCQFTMREEQMFMNFEVLNDTAIKVKSNTVEYPGSIVISLSGNSQQYINDITLHFRDKENTFLYYESIKVIQVNPTAIVKDGGTPIHIRSLNYDQFRQDNDKYLYVPIYCRILKDNEEKAQIGEVQEMKNFTGVDKICTSPKTTYIGDGIVELSINQQQWHPIAQKINFFNGPKITEVSPTYGVTKNPKNLTLTIIGDNLDCPQSDCSRIKVRFTNDKGDQIIVDGAKDGQNVKCKIPKYPAPETLLVDVALNGIEFTNSKVSYGFMDPYVLQITPRLYSPKGTTVATLHGYGFVQMDSTKQTVRFSKDKLPLACVVKAAEGEDQAAATSGACVSQIKVVDEHTITAPTLEQGLVSANGQPVSSKDPFNIDLIDMDGEYSNINIPLFYFNEISVTNASTSYAYKNQEKPIMIQVDFGWGEKNDYKTFKKFGNFSCRFTGTTPEIQQIVTEAFMEVSPIGGYIQNQLPNQIRCRTPQWSKVETVNLDISVNGIDYFGNYQIKIVEALQNIKISPMSGPIAGGTKIKLYGSGYVASDPKEIPVWIKFGVGESQILDKSSVTENDTWNADQYYNEELRLPQNLVHDTEEYDAKLTQDQAIKSYYSALSPDISNLFSNEMTDPRYAGGMQYLQLTEKVPISAYKHGASAGDLMTDYIETVYPQSSNLEYYWYRQPFVTKVEPDTGLAVGGTKITVQGGWFQQIPEYGVYPFCKVGADVIRGQFITTNRIICKTQPNSDTFNSFPISVSLNGVDWIETGASFNYYERPILDDINPRNGMAEGGTEINLKGQKFSKTKNKKLVRCRYRQVNEQGFVDADGAPTKVVPAYFVNQETMKCATPSGWKGNDTTMVDLTFNGVDFTESYPFSFYQVYSSFPKSGPADAYNQYIQVKGKGFSSKWTIMCYLDGKEIAPIKVQHNVIRCPMVHPDWPSDKYATVDFSVSVDGIHKSLGTFHYYKQVIIESINPTLGPNEGNGNIYISGRYFRGDFEGSKLSCRIGNTLARAQILDSETVKCTTNHKLPLVDEGQSLPVTVALNSYSWAPSDYSFQPYGVYNIYPTAGPLFDNTNINVIGKGFNNELQHEARCKFGTDENYQIVQAQVLDDENLICKSPSDSLMLPDSANSEISLPFSIAFQDDIYFPYTYGTQKFRLYKQPETLSADPNEGSVSSLTEVYVNADTSSGFSQPIPAAGTNTIQQDQFGIKCKFGRFGATPATYINHTTILCLTPNIADDPSSIGSEIVTLSVAMNGVDYNDEITRSAFTFTGTGNNLSIWVVLMSCLILSLLVITILFFVSGLQTYWNSRAQLQPRVVQDSHGLLQVRSRSNMSQAMIERNLKSQADMRVSAMGMMSQQQARASQAQRRFGQSQMSNNQMQ